MNRKYFRRGKDAEAHDMIHMGSDHRSVMAHFVIPAPKSRVPEYIQKDEEKLSNGRASKVRRMKCEETTRFEKRYREFEWKIKQKSDATAAACKQGEDELAKK